MGKTYCEQLTKEQNELIDPVLEGVLSVFGGRIGVKAEIENVLEKIITKARDVAQHDVQRDSRIQELDRMIESMALERDTTLDKLRKEHYRVEANTREEYDALIKKMQKIRQNFCYVIEAPYWALIQDIDALKRQDQLQRLSLSELFTDMITGKMSNEEISKLVNMHNAI